LSRIKFSIKALFLGGIRVVFFTCSHASEEGEEA
jgi:hypothetical protein